MPKQFVSARGSSQESHAATSNSPLNNGFAISRDLTPVLVPLADLSALGRETRKHSPAKIRKLGACLQQFGFALPIAIDPERRVIAGWGLVLAARRLGLTHAPAVRITDLGEASLRVLRLALNRLSEDSNWNEDALRLEFSEILELDPELHLDVTGFEMGEIDRVLVGHGIDQEDELPAVDADRPPTTRPGDLWHLGPHRVLCDDARLPESYQTLLGSDRIRLMFADPPYNVPLDQVSGRGAIKHKNFAMGCGELSPAEFTEFLKTTLGPCATHSLDGAIHFVCMDWRHLKELLAAAEGIYTALKNICVWNKSNAGMGSLYRAKHELICVFKVGKEPHVNNVALGRYGRHRTNVWDYAGQNSLNSSSKSKLSLHPTIKPIALVADAICDCSDRGDLILDVFGGAGTSLIAAERTGRRARLLEIDPVYVDATIQRWQRLTGGTATLDRTGQPFGHSGASQED